MPFFIPTFDPLIAEIGLVPANVFGLIWRYSQMEDKVCKASIQTLSARLGLHRTTVIRAIRQLLEAGLIEDLTPSLRNYPHSYRPTHQALYRIASIPEDRGLSDPLPEPVVAQSDNENVTPSPAQSQNAPAPDPVDVAIAQMYSPRDPPKLVAVAQRDTPCRSLQQAAVAQSDKNQSLLINSLIDRENDPEKFAFFDSKVEYCNSQQLAFFKAHPFSLCRFHSFDGKVFKISHPDPAFVQRLNCNNRGTYHRRLSLFIENPDFEVEFIPRDSHAG